MKMRAKIIPLLSICLISVCLLLSFTACGGKDTDADTTASSAPVTQDTAPTVSATEAQTAQQTAANVKTAPQTAAEWVTAFNQAIEKRTPKCTASAQKVEKGKLWIGDDANASLDLLAADQTALLAKFEQNSVSGTALPQLSASDVSGAKANGSTVTFSLNSVNADGSLSQGRGGYIAVVDDARTKELVEGVKSYANVSGNVKITSAAYRLNGGTLTVTFNSDFTEIQSVKYTACQNVTAKMRYLVMTINADVDYLLTAEFK